MSKRILFALGLAGTMTAGVAQADETFLDDRFYAAPFASYLHPGGDTKGFDGWGGGLGIGKIINEYFNIELRGFWQAYGNDIPGVGGRTDLTGGTVDVQYYFFRDAFSPYAVLGVGGMNTSYSRTPTASGRGFSDSSFIFEAGVGATYELHDNFLLRGDVRYRGNTAHAPRDAAGVASSNDVLNDLVVNLGFVIPFGEKPQPVAEAPAPAPQEECASRDSDHDGVNDCDDKCPGTVQATKIDDQGCPIVLELRGVNFLYDSAELTPAAKDVLDGVVEQLIAFPEKRDIEVAGYASDEGHPNKKLYNLKLSQRRS